MNDPTKALLAACLWAMLSACTAGQSPSGGKADDKAGDKAGEPEPEGTKSTSDDSPDVPVPIFLTDPDAQLVRAADAVNAVALGDADTSEMFDSQASAKSTTDSLSQSFGALSQSLKAIVLDQFKGQAVTLRHGAPATFDVSAVTFPPRLPVKYLRVSVESTTAPVSYRVEGFCPKGKDDAQVCLSYSFGDATSEMGTRVRLAADWAETSTLLPGDWSSLIEYGGGEPMGSAFRLVDKNTQTANVAFGINVPNAPQADRHFLDFLMLQLSDAKPPLLLPDLPRPRFARSQRRAGDVWSIQGISQPSADELVRRQAFVPSTELKSDVLASTIFATNGLDSYVTEALLETVRDPEANADCATSGAAVRAAFTGGSVPTEVSSLPDDVCQETATTTDQALLAALGEVCTSGIVLNFQVTVNRKLRLKDDVDVCAMRQSVEFNRNPQFFTVTDAGKTQILAADAGALAGLAGELEAIKQPQSLATIQALNDVKFGDASLADLEAAAAETAASEVP